MGDNLENPDGSEQQGVSETVMQSDQERRLHMHLQHLQGISATSRLNSMLGSQIKIFDQRDLRPEKSLSVLMLMSPGSFPGSCRRSLE